MEQLICWVCCKDLGFHAVGICGHNDMCLYCACRLRILLKDNKCPICKTNLPKILITKNPSARFEDYPELDSGKNEYGIICDTSEAQQAYSKIQSLDCWLPNCRNPKNKTLAQLKKHIDSHKLRFCNICLKGRLIFIWEQKCYSHQELKRHMQYGDEDISPHRECLFCKSYHYDENELGSHLEAKHFFCNVCEEKSYIYYENYDKLKLHFQKSHYVCHDPTCADNRFSVFKTPYDLQLHTIHFHMDKEKMTKAQKQQLSKLQIVEEQPARPNTEGIDFSSQFAAKKAQEETKQESKPNPQKQKTKNYVIKKKKVQIVDYKTLPKKPEKEVIEMIKEAMSENPSNFEDFKTLAMKFNKGQASAETLLNKFVEAVGHLQGEILFPILITTLKSQEKQEELHTEYTKYMELKQNISSDGKCCNSFADCSMDASLFRILTQVIEAELSSRPEDKTRKSLFIHPSQLIQMAAIIDKLNLNDMCKFMYIMNFGITNVAKTAILNMIERANDQQFNQSLQVKYEDYFLKDIEPQNLYVIHRYCEMCLAKLQGRPLKEDSKLLNNWEETKSVAKKKEDEEENENTQEKGWASVLLKKNAKAPSNIEKNFPSLATPAQKEPPGWGKQSKPLFIDNSSVSQNSFPSIGTGINSNFPSLDSSFPSLCNENPIENKKKVEKKILVETVSSPAINDMQFLIEKGFTITKSKKVKKKKGK
jgi:hypothetical protein